MVSDGRQLLTTVLGVDGPAVHLAPALHAGAPRLTLCRQPVGPRVSTRTFHRLGCVDCAVEAIHLGTDSIGDLRQAVVNLPRFLAARRPADAMTHGLPLQRSSEDAGVPPRETLGDR